MRKFLTLLSVLFGMLLFTSCETTAVVATETDGAYYIDRGNHYLVIYIDGVAHYQLWDRVYHRYYFRPVPVDRIHYITPRPHMRHRYVPNPPHNNRYTPQPPHRPNNGGINHRPNPPHNNRSTHNPRGRR
jgi:hypothetical protein